IFVIDMQDMSRITIAVEYLDKILHYIASKGMNVHVSVFFHKMDKGTPEDRPILERKASDLADQISNTIPRGLAVEFFTTNIFTVFQKERIK
nr:hypothetical protein [Candidatus Sigynarchaeota archaeon]